MKIKNPKLTITTESTLNGLYVLDNGNIVATGDLTGTIETVALRDVEYDGFYVYIGEGFTVDDAVNCTYDDYGQITITDPTKDASCTVYAAV